MLDKGFISIVIPVYGDKKLVRMLYDKLVESLNKINIEFEIIMVNDCCPYGSGEEIAKLAMIDNRVKLIDLQRNFGQHLAIKAGLDNVTGNGYTVVMDCDLQDNPDDIIRFYKKIKETNADVVVGCRSKRAEGFLKKLYSKTAHFFINKLSETSNVEEKDTGNFSIFNQKVLKELQSKQEPYFVFGTIIAWAGFSVEYIEVEQEQRACGKSGYNFIKGLNHLKRIIVNNSNKPLIFAGICSFLMFIFCLLFIAKLLIGYFVFNQRLLGWTSVMVSLFFIAALLFAYLGLLGIYVGQIFKITQGRPLYTVKRKINL